MEVPLDLKMMMDGRSSGAVSGSNSEAVEVTADMSKIIPGQILTPTQLHMVASSGVSIPEGYSSSAVGGALETGPHSLSEGEQQQQQQHQRQLHTSNDSGNMTCSNGMTASIVSSLPSSSMFVPQQVVSSGVVMSSVNSSSHLLQLRSPPLYSTGGGSSGDMGVTAAGDCNGGVVMSSSSSCITTTENSRNMTEMGSYCTDATGQYAATAILRCLECNTGFISRREYDNHMASHSAISKSLQAANTSQEDNQPIMIVVQQPHDAHGCSGVPVSTLAAVKPGEVEYSSGSVSQAFPVECGLPAPPAATAHGPLSATRRPGPLSSNSAHSSFGQQPLQRRLQQPQTRQQQHAQLKVEDSSLTSGSLVLNSSSSMMPGNIEGASYVVAATDLHQLQQSGGELLVQTTTGARQDRLARQPHQNLPQQIILHSGSQQMPVTSQQGEHQHQQQQAVANSKFVSPTGPQGVAAKRADKTRSAAGSSSGGGGGGGDTVKLVPFDRPYKCDKCTASFIEQDECEEHRRKHSGDGPFTCEDCHFNFMYKSHYKSHKARCEKKRASMPAQPAPLLKAPIVAIKREFPTHDTLRENLATNTRKRNSARTPANRLGAKTNPNVVFTSAGVVSQASSQDVYSYSKFSICSDNEELAADDPAAVATMPSTKTAAPPPAAALKRPFPATKVKKEAELNKFNPVLPSFKRLKQQHNTARPYECDSCDASFTNAEDLDTHRQKHSSDGPYRCDSCQYLYLYRRLYDAHKRKCKKGRSKRDGPVGAALQSSANAQLQQQQQQQQHQQQAPSAGVAVQVNQGTSGQFTSNVLPQHQQQPQSIQLHNHQQSNFMLIEQQPQTFKSVQARSVQLPAVASGDVSASSEQQQLQQQQQQQLQPVEMGGTTALLVPGPQGNGGGVIDAQHLQLHALHGAGVQVLELRGDELVAVAAGDAVRAGDGEAVKYELVQTVDPAAVPHIVGLLKKGAMGPAVAQ